MSEQAKWTKGPLTFERMTRPVKGGGARTYFQVMAEDRSIVTTEVDGFIFEPALERLSESENEANANLYAEAPAMAEALQDIDDAWAGNGDMATAVDHVLLVLARVKGGQ